MSRTISRQRVVTVSFAVNLLDIATNLVVAVLTGSAVVFAEMSHGLADALGSLLLVTGDHRSRRPRDAKHPLGYGREPFFWALLSALAMLTVGAGIAAWWGYRRLVEPQALDRPLFAVAVLVLAIVTNGYAVSLSARKLCAEEGGLLRAFRSSRRPLVRTALLQDGLGTLSAVLGLVAVTISVVADIEVADGVGALTIAALMAVAAVALIVRARELITGRAASESDLEAIRRAVLGVPAVIAINRLAAVYSGSAEVLVELDLDLADDLRTADIERTLDEIQVHVSGAVPEAQAVRVDLNSPETGLRTVPRSAGKG